MQGVQEGGISLCSDSVVGGRGCTGRVGAVVLGGVRQCGAVVVRIFVRDVRVCIGVVV